MDLRALVVDDSIIFRKVVRDCLTTIPGVEVVGVARDGHSAVEAIRSQRPDVVTLDVEMPGLDGLEVLEALEREKIDTTVIMISSHTQRGATTTTRALEIGAFDFILKPNHGAIEDNIRELGASLRIQIEAIRRRSGLSSSPSRIRRTTPTTQAMPAASVPAKKQASMLNLDAICIGISTGGPKALSEIIPALPAELSVPILVVQHMPPIFTATMAGGLDQQSKVNVVEATDGMRLCGGTVYIAPGGKQMRVGGYAGCWTAEITDDPAIKSCKPSVDFLFHSAAQQFGARVLGIIMTGMGDDGVDGCRSIARKGGTVWAQDQATSIVYGMPRQIVDHGLADEVRSLQDIGRGIVQQASRAKAVTR